MRMIAPGNIWTTMKESIDPRFPRNWNREKPYAPVVASSRPSAVVPTDTRTLLRSQRVNCVSKRIVEKCSVVQPGRAWPRRRTARKRGKGDGGGGAGGVRPRAIAVPAAGIPAALRLPCGHAVEEARPRVSVSEVRRGRAAQPREEDRRGRQPQVPETHGSANEAEYAAEELEQQGPSRDPAPGSLPQREPRRADREAEADDEQP